MRKKVRTFIRILSVFKISLLACLLFLHSGQAVGAEYYVNITGGIDDDTINDGLTPTSPWKTLHYAFGSTSPVVDNDIINVQAGTYSSDPVSGEDTSQLVISKNGLSVLAFGTVVVESSSLSAGTWLVGIRINANQVRLQGLEIRGFPESGVEVNGEQNIIDNCNIHNNSGYGIHLNTGQDNAVQNNCDIAFNSFDGIYIGSILNVIDFCHVHDNSGFGIYIDGFNASASDNQIIGDCEIFQNQMGGIEIYDSPNNLIQDNIAIGAGIYDNGSASTGNGIHISGAAAISNDIISNRIYHSGNLSNVQDIGINIDGSVAATNINVLGNTIEAHTNCGVLVSNCDAAIKINKFADNNKGIRIDANGGIAAPLIWSNLFYSGSGQMQYGIYMETNSGGEIISSSQIHHNTIDGASEDGIEINDLTSSATPEIFYNIISNSASNGIDYIFGTAGPAVAYNNVYNYGSAAAAYQGFTGSPGTGDIIGVDTAQNPGYVSAGSDYHLSAASPCIDTIPGSSAPEDLDGISRPQDISAINNGGTWDMGCYEYVEDLTDTDGDGLADAIEVAGCTDPNNPDSDFDGIDDGVEITDGTDPCDSDSDGDGYTDGEEDLYGTDPVSIGIYPELTPGEYWVDPNPDVLGFGTSAGPWNSLHRAIHHINMGAPGVYTLQVLAGTYQVEISGGREPDEVLFITQDNLTIQGGGIGNTIIDGTGTVDGPGSWIDGLDVHDAANVTILNLEVRNFPANGIHMGGAVNSIVETCSLHGNVNSGLVIEGDGGTTHSSGNIVRNGCEIYDNGTDTISGAGIYVFGTVSDNTAVFNNHIYYSDDPDYIQEIGVKIDGGGSDNQVIGNTISGHNNMGNGFGIEVLNSDAEVKRNILFDNAQGIRVSCEPAGNADPEIWNNLIYDGPDSNMDYGIFLQVNGAGGDVSPTIYHNTIDGGANDGIYIYALDGSASPRIEFNIISKFDAYGINNDGGYGLPSIDFNNVWGNASSYAFGSGGPNAISVAPEYVDETAGDYHLQSTSGCIDVIPVPTSGPTHPLGIDLDGVSRPQGTAYDSGCYEAISELAEIYYTVTFVAGTGGSINGSASQTVLDGGNCTSVTAVADTGYEFTGWSGSYNGTTNPLTITNVTSDKTITAIFEPVIFTVSFTAGPGGSISGNTVQSILSGGGCSEVTAIADTGYEFTGWSGDYTGMGNPLVIANVIADKNITANFEIKTYDVSVISGANGSLDGNVDQEVVHGGDTTSITAVPETGFYFTGWSGDYTGMENPLVLLNVTAGMQLVANFEINIYNVVFYAEDGGSLSGETVQVIEYGKSCSPVTAIAGGGYEFTGWSGDADSTDNSLTVENVTSDMSVTANFAANHSPDTPVLISPVGKAVVDQGAVTLTAGDFYDPESDAHIESRWQIRRAGESNFFYNITSSADLTEHVTGNILENGVKYEWRVGYVDAGSRLATWSARGAFIAGKAVADENIPAIPPGFTMKDYRLMSFIQWPVDYDFLNIVDTPTGADTGMEDFKIGAYNPMTGDYAQYPDLEIEPGRAYWILARYGMKLAMEGVFVSVDQDFQLNLLYNEESGNGWNMIGSPNSAYYSWVDVEVIEADDSGNIIYGPVPVSMLPDNNEYIDKRIWRWEGDGYVSDDSDVFVIQPYEGVWVKSKKKNIALVFPVSSQAGLFELAAIKGKEIIGRLFNRITPAYADTASGDSPPMPMGVSDGGDSGSDLGCFIKVISEKEN